MSGSIVLGMIGIVFVILGYLIWKKEKISFLHGYHYDKVSENDRADFCMLSGIGVISIGAGILLTAVIIGITDSVWSFAALAVGFTVGLALLIYAGNTYNR